MIRKIIYISFALIHFYSVLSNENKINIGITNAFPFIYTENKIYKGYFVDTFNLCAHKLEGKLNYIEMTNTEIEHNFEQNNIQIAFNVTNNFKAPYLSQPVFKHENIAVTLKKKSLKIKKISELSNYKVVSFQGATQRLGSIYSTTVSKSKDYTEYSNQTTPINLIFMNRADVRIGSKMIFLSLLKEHSKYFPNSKIKLSDFDIHHIFKPNYAYLAFQDAKLGKIFDQCFKQEKASGNVEKVYNNYK